MSAYEVCPEAIQPCNMKNRDIYWRRYKIQETLYIGQWHLSPLQNKHLGTSHRALPVSISCPVVFSWISLMVWNLFPFEGNLVLGKARCHRAPNLGYRWLSHLEDLMFHQKLCTRRDAWAGVLLWWSCQSPVAHSCGLLNHPNSFLGGMFMFKPKSDADLLLYSLSHFECDGHTVHLLTQQHLPRPLTSTVKSSLSTHGHSSPVSLAARLHRCHTNYSHYTNKGWASSGQTSYI